MATLNKVFLIGRLVKDPDFGFVPNGPAVSNFTLAVNRPFKNKNNERETDFIDIVAWRKLAEHCKQYLEKGKLVLVEGRLQIRNYETKEGSKRKIAEIVADNIQFLDKFPQKADNDNNELPPMEEIETTGSEFSEPSNDEENIPF